MSRPEPADAESDDRKLRYLKGTELFRDFTPAQLEPFHHTIRMETCPTGHVFYRPGESDEVMFLLKQGRAQLYRLAADGRKFVLPMYHPRRSSASGLQKP
jgi:CRP-like cAMP-binding protein